MLSCCWVLLTTVRMLTTLFRILSSRPCLRQLQNVDPVSSVTVKSGANAGNQVNKREILLVDQSMKTIRMTLWDENIHLVNENEPEPPCIAFKAVKVGDFGGRSLSLTRSSMVSAARETEREEEKEEGEGVKSYARLNGICCLQRIWLRHCCLQHASRRLSRRMSGPEAAAAGQLPIPPCLSLSSRGLPHHPEEPLCLTRF